MDCATRANIMSCQAMVALTKQEYERNTSAFRHVTKCPEDAPIDYDRRSLGYDSLCFTHDPALKAGDYFRQIENVRKESFDKWTRQKTVSAPFVLDTSTIAQDLDSQYYYCQANRNIPCGIHPFPCRIK